MNNQNEANDVVMFLLKAAKEANKDKLLKEDALRAYSLIYDFVSSLDDAGVTAILAALLIVAHDLCENMRVVKNII